MTKNILEHHTVHSFDEELQTIVAMIKEMRHVVVEMLDMLALSLSSGDKELVSKAIKIDKRLNQLDLEINNTATKILALRQPVAIDLRFVISSVKISTILERMGDMVKSSIKKLAENHKIAQEEIRIKFLEMIELVIKMVKNSTKSFGKIDPEKANKVWEREEKVDELGHQIFNELQNMMKTDSSSVELSVKLLFTMKNIERIGDYATNIAKLANYVYSGERGSRKVTGSITD